MEASGVFFRPLPCLSGAGFDTHSSKLTFSSSVTSKNVVDLRLVDHGDSRKVAGVSSSGFADGGHLQYYASPVKAGLTKEKEKKMKKDSEAKSLKKKLKLIKGMSKDLLRFSSMGFGVEAEDGLVAEIKGKKISEATEILLSQLQQLKAEEKELKRKKKEEKAKLRAATQMKTAMVCESNSSSESSDSECGEVIDMSSLRSVGIGEPKMDEPQLEIEIEIPVQAISISQIETSTSCCRSEGRVMVEATAEKIEVCMGGKCKKSGATALLEEFQERVGVEGVVVGCKCMGKCRDGPNVRIAKKLDDDEVRPLCIGVGLEDVGVILGNFFGEERKDLGLVVA